MPVTDEFGLPFPSGTDDADGADQIAALARATDAALANLRDATSDLATRAAPAISETLPGDPGPGQRALLYLPDAGEEPVIWEMVFSQTLGLWLAAGGSPAIARDDSNGTRASGAVNYDDLTGTAVGPVIHIPAGYSGQVLVRLEARIQVAGGGQGKVSVRRGTDTPDDSNAVLDDSNTSNSTSTRMSGAFDVSGGDTLTMKYSRNTTGTTTVGRRAIAVYPLTAETV